MSEMYKRFTWEELDFSEKSLYDMYMFESTGKPELSLLDRPVNGYLVGKHWMDSTVKMWNEDLRKGLLFRFELEEEYPKWFLDKVLNM